MECLIISIKVLMCITCKNIQFFNSYYSLLLIHIGGEDWIADLTNSLTPRVADASSPDSSLESETSETNDSSAVSVLLQTAAN